MRYLLSLLLILSFGFAQKTIVVKKQADDEKKVEVLKEVKDGKVIFKITEDGKTEEHEFNIDDEDAIAKIQQKLDAYDGDATTKVKIYKNVKKHDCKKENCDPAKCKHANKKECKNDAMVWNTKDGCDKKNLKIIKKYKVDDEPLLIDEKTGFLGVQIQDLSEQLSDYFKVKDGNGVLVSEVVKDSPAEKAGLKAGDIITKVDAEEIENAADLTATIRSYDPETKVSVSVIRDGKKKKLNATLGQSENSFMYKFGDLGEMGEKHKMMLKMHPENLDEFEFHVFPFDQEQFKEQMEDIQKQLQEMKEDLKKLKEEK